MLKSLFLHTSYTKSISKEDKMRKILRICMLALLAVSIIFLCDKAFASSDTFIKTASVSKYGKHADKTEPFLKRDSASVLTGTSDILTVYKVPDNSYISYKSSDESILTVNPGENNTCEYTGVSVGTATITIKIQEPVFLFVTNTYTLKLEVEVTPKAVSVKFRKTKYKLGIGESRKLQYTLRPSITDEIPKFESSDNDIVSVSSKGKIYAKAKGTAYITATILNGNYDTCKITIN